MTTMAPKTPSPFSDELLDQLLANYTKPDDLTGKDGILVQVEYFPDTRSSG